ncbi:hypothetical protein MRX96_022514 [Rhipicephalus microplus]
MESRPSSWRQYQTTSKTSTAPRALRVAVGRTPETLAEEGRVGVREKTTASVISQRRKDEKVVVGNDTCPVHSVRASLVERSHVLNPWSTGFIGA